MNDEEFLLAGDVGGTKASLAVYSRQRGLRTPVMDKTLASTDFPDLTTLLLCFLREVDVPVERVCLGVAGPVVKGGAEITNLGWKVSEAELARNLGIREVRLINDLLALAYAVPYLQKDDIFVINQGETLPGGAIAIIAPGTGLGKAFLTWNGHQYCPQPSEGGHRDFAPNSPLECELWHYLSERYGHVSCERVCSGLGIPNLYAFLKERGYASESEWLAMQLATAEDPTPIILQAALAEMNRDNREKTVGLCEATLQLFLDILAAEAGNLALEVLATAGVYLGGGILPRILPALDRGRFMSIFCRKGRVSELLSKIPVAVILTPKAAVLGAAVCGLELGET